MDSDVTLTWSLFVRHGREMAIGAGMIVCACFFLCRGNGNFTESVLLAAFLWAAAVFDYHYGLIFDRLTGTMAVCALWFRFQGQADFMTVVSGAAAGGVPLLLICILSGGGIGGGDIKLAAAGGLWLGWQGAFLSLALASWTGGAVAAFLMLSGRRGRRDAVAFGPFLSLGIGMSFFFGSEILTLYGRCFHG